MVGLTLVPVGGGGGGCRHSGGQVKNHQQQGSGEVADGVYTGGVLLHN